MATRHRRSSPLGCGDDPQGGGRRVNHDVDGHGELHPRPGQHGNAHHRHRAHHHRGLDHPNRHRDRTPKTTGSIPCDDDDDCMTPGAPFCGPAGECTDCDGMNDPDAACAGLDEGTPRVRRRSLPPVHRRDRHRVRRHHPDLRRRAKPMRPRAPSTPSARTPVPATSPRATASPPTRRSTSMETEARTSPPSPPPSPASVPRAKPSSSSTTPPATTTKGSPSTKPKTLALFAAPGDEPQWVQTGWRQPNGNDRRNGLPPRLALDTQRQHHRPRGQHPGRPGVAGPRQGRRQRRRRHRRDRLGRPRPCETRSWAAVSTTCTHWRSPAQVPTCCTRRWAGGTFNANALRCTLPMAVNVRNSILVTRGGTPPDEVACTGASVTIEYSATEGKRLRHRQRRPWVPSPAALHRTGSPTSQAATSTCRTTASPTSLTSRSGRRGDPAQDIDGDARPNVDATPDVAGADVP